MKTIHNINIGDYIKQKSSSFQVGFIDGLFGVLPNSQFRDSEAYDCGYADGAQYKSELRGTAHCCLIRKLRR